MRKRVYIALGVVLVALVGVIGWQGLREREPVYQGKPLSLWLVQYGRNHWEARNGELDKQAEAAIRQIGPNAIPHYLKMMASRESPLKLKLMSLVPTRLQTRFPMRNLDDYRFGGACGLIALGEDAKSSVPALTALLNDADPEVRHAALFALRYLGPEAADTQQWLIECLKDPRFTMQGDAKLVLSELRQNPERAIPILVKFLDESQNAQDSLMICANAIWLLGQFGPEAKPAVPSLLRLLDDAHEGIRFYATNALNQIDPEAAAKAGVK